MGRPMLPVSYQALHDLKPWTSLRKSDRATVGTALMGT